MGRKVLVVDDEKLIVKGLRYSLAQDGMEVDCAFDGEEAMDYARKTEYDAIYMQMKMQKEVVKTYKVVTSSEKNKDSLGSIGISM